MRDRYIDVHYVKTIRFVVNMWCFKNLRNSIVLKLLPVLYKFRNNTEVNVTNQLIKFVTSDCKDI